MGEENAAAQPTRAELERQLSEASRRALDAEVRANRLYTQPGVTQEAREQAYADASALKDEVKRLELALDALDQPAATVASNESILDELGPESEHAQLLAGMGERGEGQTVEQAQSEANRRNARVLISLAVAGTLFVIAALIWMASQNGPPLVGDASQTPSAAQPSATVPRATSSPTTTSAPSVTAAPTVTPLPLAQRPATGSSFGPGWFTRTDGSCLYADEFASAFALEATDGQLVITQLDLAGEHVTTGTLTRSGPSSGLLLATAQGQRYDATIRGNTIDGTYLDTASGCNDTYDFRIQLDQPLLAPAPFSTVPGYFEFVDGDDRPVDTLDEDFTAASLRLLSRDEFDFSSSEPIAVTLHVGDTTPWQFQMAGDAAAAPVPIPENIVDLMFDSINQSALVARDNEGQLLAVYAPHDLDWTLRWILETLDGSGAP